MKLTAVTTEKMQHHENDLYTCIYILYTLGNVCIYLTVNHYFNEIWNYEVDFFSTWHLVIVLKGKFFVFKNQTISKYDFFLHYECLVIVKSFFLYWYIIIDFSVWWKEITNNNEFTPSQISYFIYDYFSWWRIEPEKRENRTRIIQIHDLRRKLIVSAAVISDHSGSCVYDEIDLIVFSHCFEKTNPVKSKCIFVFTVGGVRARARVCPFLT